MGKMKKTTWAATSGHLARAAGGLITKGGKEAFTAPARRPPEVSAPAKTKPVNKKAQGGMESPLQRALRVGQAALAAGKPEAEANRLAKAAGIGRNPGIGGAQESQADAEYIARSIARTGQGDIGAAVRRARRARDIARQQVDLPSTGGITRVAAKGMTVKKKAGSGLKNAAKKMRRY